MKGLQRSFSGGELAPELYGRLDLDKYQAGLAECLNFVVLPHGPVQNRAGFSYILQTKYNDKQSNLIEFSYSTDQTYILEFGNQYIRFHTNGGTLLETGQNITGITNAGIGVLSYSGTDPVNGDWFYISGISGMTELNGRYVIVSNVNAVANTFELTDLRGAPINTSGYAAWSSGGTIAKVYEISSPYLEADLFNIHYVQSADVLTLVHPSYEPRELRRSTATTFALSTISFVPTVSAPTGVSAAATVGTGTDSFTYVVTTVSSDNLEESVASTATTPITNNLTTSGNYNTITWSAATGAIRYNVYKNRNGLYGYVGQTEGLTFKDQNITADVTRTPPQAQNPFSGAGNYPGAVSYFEQRRCFAGTNNKPQNMWMTRSATESNLNYSIPTQDDDAIALRIVSREVQRIRHIIPLTELILLTSGGEWKISTQNSDALTPSSVTVRPQAYNGATNVQPVVTGSSAIYVRNQSGRIHDLNYNFEINGFKSSDLSLVAPHLFDAYSITDMTLTRTPYPIVWVTRSDGVLLGLTYMPDQKVFAWHQHQTDGLIESCAAVAEGNRDVLYIVVKRVIDGITVRYVERLSDREFEAIEDSFIVDSGLTYDSTPTTSISGLYHLEGETVVALADGAVVKDLLVTNGKITLPQSASLVHVGVAYTSRIKTLPISFDGPALGQGMVKNINSVKIRVYRSSNIKAGPSVNNLRQYKQRTTEPYGTAPNWVTDEVEIIVDPSWNNGGQIVVEQDDPLPLTLLSMVTEYAIGR